MRDIVIDDEAFAVVQEYMRRENADALRIFIGGGGCCKWLEVAGVKSALDGDVEYMVRGLKLYVEGSLAEAVSLMILRCDDQGVRVELVEKE